MGRRAKGEAPCVRVDRSSGCGRVIIGGKTYWLGRCPDGKPTAEQQAKAARLWHEHLSGHPAAPPTRPADPLPPAVISTLPTPLRVEVNGITIAALGMRWLDHCEAYYRDREGNPTSSVDGARMALRCLFPFGDVAAAAFTPRDLTVVRDAMIRDGRPRVTCNAVTKTIRRMFRWGVCEGLVPPAVWQALASVDPLRKGRTEAPELPPVREVAESVVSATLPHLPRIVAAMVWLQRWTGSRPDEVCIVRPCDIDRSHDVWVFTPRHHKLDWREDAQPRRIAIGAEGQKV